MGERVSVIMAVADGTETIAAAAASLLAQSHRDWECVVVSDDGRDYRAILAEAGIDDRRYVQVSTGGHLTGCAAARNVGLAAATGDFVTRLDADDTYCPERLALLVPVAAAHGAATDNLDQIDLDGGAALLKPFPPTPERFLADFETIGALDTPIVPLVRRDHVFPWYETVDIAEDVVFALRLVAALGRLPVVARPTYAYRIRLGSMCHGDDGAERADRSYAAIIADLEAGALVGIDAALGARMAAVFRRKRALNRAFGEAYGRGEARTFPEFCQRLATAARRVGG
jgi:succinoglycan biosynthesis protein ExoO